jgi:hypothetical protein
MSCLSVCLCLAFYFCLCPVYVLSMYLSIFLPMSCLCLCLCLCLLCALSLSHVLFLRYKFIYHFALGAYCSVKAGLDHLSRSVALDQAQMKNGAKIVSLAPGVISTDMQLQLRETDSMQFPNRQRFVELHESGSLDSPNQAASKCLAFLELPNFGASVIADVRH